MKKLSSEQMNERVAVTCYKKTKSYLRSKAIDYFRRAILACDPDSSECDRYTNIYCQLMGGETEISDERAYRLL